MQTQQFRFRKTSCQPFNLPHSQSQAMLNTCQAPKVKQSPQKFRRRSLKLKNIHLNQQISQQDSTKNQNLNYPNVTELKFLADIVKRKHQSGEIKAHYDYNPVKNSKDYEYYDMIVRDLISEIRNRNSKDLSPLPSQKVKIIDKIERTSPSKDKIELKTYNSRGKLDYGSIKPNSHREKIAFNLGLNGFDTVYQRKITTYIQFLYKLNFSNRLYVDLSLSKPKTVYKIKIGPGNNSRLLKSLIQRRFWLEITTDDDYQFSWTQLTVPNVHQSQSKFEVNQQIIRERPPKLVKLLKNSSEESLRKIMRKEEIAIANEWYSRSDCGKISCFNQVKIDFVSNHIPLNCIIGAKRILFKVMFWYYSEILSVDPFIVLPKTYSFQSGVTQSYLKQFIEKHKQSKKIWIVKPGENSNRGNGIKIVDTTSLMALLYRQRSKGSQMRPLIVQQYLRPFLYCGRKFDIRHYLLITTHNGCLRAYWYKEGYIRTSSQRYDIEDMDEMIHLTNDAVQKRGERYGKYEAANKLSYSQFQRYLDSTHPHKHFNFYQQILKQMKVITTDLMRASFQFIDPERKRHNFQIYGLDFYISNKFKPHLIQCNANPCLQINCPILERIIPGAVEHALRIGLDPLFPPPQHYPPTSRYHLCDKVLQKLKYELIFDEKIEGPALREKAKLCCNQLNLTGIKLRPDEDEFDDEGQQLGQAATLD